jgi:RNA polymerase sigma-70 factor, ECF subfamily
MSIPAMRADSDETERLLAQVSRGEHTALDALLASHRPAMRRVVELHMGPRFRARLDPSDVVQDAQLEMTRRLADFLNRKPMPFHLWARKTVYERLLNAQRDQQAACRDVGREAAGVDQSSVLLAVRLISTEPTPSHVALVQEEAERVARIVAALPEDEREILLLRLVDDLPYDEIACVLGIGVPAARQRYGRALLRLQKRVANEELSDGA